MLRVCTAFLVCSTAASLFTLAAHGQDSQSLGDVARLAKEQKQKQADQAKGKASKAPKVVTNEDIPEHPEDDAQASMPADQEHESGPSTSAAGGAKIPAEQWKSQIQAQKNAVASLQSNIARLNDSIHFAPGNCVAGCVQWNERQQAKQQEVERARGQLAEQKKRLEDMQESARQQGYGSSVYDP